MANGNQNQAPVTITPAPELRSRMAAQGQPRKREPGKPSVKGDSCINATVSMPADEKRKPLAVMFYDFERKALQFDRVEGVSLEEFCSIMRQAFPNYGADKIPGKRGKLKKYSVIQ